jgi:hypothetical protein
VEESSGGMYRVKVDQGPTALAPNRYVMHALSRCS